MLDYLFNKVAGLKVFIKKILKHRRFPENIAKLMADVFCKKLLHTINFGQNQTFQLNNQIGSSQLFSFHKPKENV